MLRRSRNNDLLQRLRVYQGWVYTVHCRIPVAPPTPRIRISIPKYSKKSIFDCSRSQSCYTDQIIEIAPHVCTYTGLPYHIITMIMHAVFTKKINEKILQIHSKSYNP